MENTNENLGEGTTNVENLAAGNGEINQTVTQPPLSDETLNLPADGTNPVDANKSEGAVGNVSVNDGMTVESQDNGDAKSSEAPAETLGEKISDELNKAEEFVGEKFEEAKEKVEDFFEKDEKTAETQGEELIDDAIADVAPGIATAEEAVDHNDQTKFPPSQV